MRSANKAFELPVENDLFKQLRAAGVIPRPIAENVETEVAWFAVGPARFATHPGESAPAYTWATESLMDTAPKIVLGLGLDQLGYILKTDFFDDTANIPHADYLVKMSLRTDTKPLMMAALESIIP